MAVSRFRVEEGKSCIDVRLKSVRQLFDLRDPAPFRERDLDPAAAAHILSTVQELPSSQPLKIVLHVAEPIAAPLDASVVREAIRLHFEYERSVVQGKLRGTFLRGRRIAAVGIGVLVLFLSLAEATVHLPEGAVRPILREGLVITGWVAMWRPVETFLYDWWPLLEERRWLNKVLSLEVDVRETRASVVPTQPRVESA
ncbi:MAG: hypothetical protein KF819_19580 [Labilithrix sp.]|nr:hypothetical protein [Labilithrix sp.]